MIKSASLGESYRTRKHGLHTVNHGSPYMIECAFVNRIYGRRHNYPRESRTQIAAMFAFCVYIGGCKSILTDKSNALAHIEVG